MSGVNFICGSCSSVMCSDCKEIASEYAEILILRNRRISELERKLEAVTREADSSRRLSTEFEKIAKLGLPAIIQKWIDSQVEEKTGKRDLQEGERREDRIRAAASLVIKKRWDSELSLPDLFDAIDELERVLQEGEKSSR